MKKVDVLVIGSTPTALVMSMLLEKKGVDVLCIDKDEFKKTQKIESILPSSMDIYKEAGCLSDIEDKDFQYKNGIKFDTCDYYKYFNFSEKSTDGAGSSYQIPKNDYVDLLLKNAKKRNIDIRFETKIDNLETKKDCVVVELKDKKGSDKIKAKFIIDASGTAMAKIKKIDFDTLLEKQVTYFAQLEDKIKNPLYDGKKTVVIPHHKKNDIWFYVIPIANKQMVLGIAGSEDDLKVKGVDKNNNDEVLKYFVDDSKRLSQILKNYPSVKNAVRNEGEFKVPKKLVGDKFLIIPNFEEYLSPIFSNVSYLSIHATKLALEVTLKILKDKKCDLKDEYEDELMETIGIFKSYTECWNSGLMQEALFCPKPDEEIEKMLSSILAGYTWDKKNPYVTKPKARLKSLIKICKG